MPDIRTIQSSKYKKVLLIEEIYGTKLGKKT